jgi:hypothetical protein
MANAAPVFTVNPAVKDRDGQYVEMTVRTAAILKSWKSSLMSFEWLLPDGTIRALDELPLKEREKRLTVEAVLRDGRGLPKPVLGIGIMDNVEIGSGRDVFLTLAALGHEHIPVYIPKSCLKDFKAFLIS